MRTKMRRFLYTTPSPPTHGATSYSNFALIGLLTPPFEIIATISPTRRVVTCFHLGFITMTSTDETGRDGSQ